MDVRKIFEILGIQETKDESGIKNAYRKQLAVTNPEDNPEGFKRLRAAYEEALKYVRQEDIPAENISDTPVTQFLKRLDDLYRSLSRRLDRAQWECLLKDEILDNLDLCEDAKWGFFQYLSSHHELPPDVWHLLDQTFHIVRDSRQFQEHLPVSFVKYILFFCSEDADDACFPFAYLEGSDTADYDEFIHKLNDLSQLMDKSDSYDDREKWLAEVSGSVAYLESLQISHPYFDLEKARYALKTGRSEEALETAEHLMTLGLNTPRLLFVCAQIFRECGRTEEALQICRTFLGPVTDKNIPDTSRRTPSDTYTAAVFAAEILLHRKAYDDAFVYADLALDTYHTKEAWDLMTDISAGILEQFANQQRSGAEPGQEEAIRLARCFRQTGRAKEGAAYFKEHAVLTADTPECHRARALLFQSAGMYQEALEATEQCARCLEQSPERDETAISGNLELRGIILGSLYKIQEDKHSSEAVRQKGEAFSAFYEARKLTPKSIPLLMNLLGLIRLMWECEPSQEYYRQGANLCEDIKELDSGEFWACFYAQEAYEKLDMPQKVIDNFYEAKKIYGGLPEIYERAVRVFIRCRQFADAEDILRQAREAGVSSACLKVLELEYLWRSADSEEKLLKSESFAGQIIAQMEEQLKEMQADRENDPGQAPSGLQKQLAEAYRLRAVIHDNNGQIRDFKDLDRIEQWAVRSLELNDTYAIRYFFSYFYMYEKPDSRRAYEHLKICEMLGPNPWVFFRMAQCHEEWSQWDEAITYYQKGAELAPEEDDFLWRIAWLYRTKFIRTGQWEYYREAIRYLDLQTERFGTGSEGNGHIWWQYSDLHARRGEYEKALEEIEKGLECTRHSRDLGHKALLLELLGRCEEAVRVYEESIEAASQHKTDYPYAYSQMFGLFCRDRAYADGLAWFLERQTALFTDVQREKNLYFIKCFYLYLGEWKNAMDTLVQIYSASVRPGQKPCGSLRSRRAARNILSLKKYVFDTWEKEGQRIDRLLDAYQFFLSKNKLRARAKEAISLLERPESAGLKEHHGAKRDAYLQIAFCYADYLLEDETALIYFKKALEHAQLSAGKADSSLCYTLKHLMGCLWRLGRPEEASTYRALYMDAIAGGSYQECGSLNKSPEEFYESACPGRPNLYSLFLLDLYSGQYEKAESRLKALEKCQWCWNCIARECTELWECRGYLALIRGNRKAAIDAFRRARSCAEERNDDAGRELRRLGAAI